MPEHLEHVRRRRRRRHGVGVGVDDVGTRLQRGATAEWAVSAARKQRHSSAGLRRRHHMQDRLVVGREFSSRSTPFALVVVAARLLVPLSCDASPAGKITSVLRPTENFLFFSIFFFLW
jgi:hypothetical protein